MKVYIVFWHMQWDSEGIVEIFEHESDAEAKVKELEADGDVEYFYEEYSVTKKKV